MGAGIYGSSEQAAFAAGQSWSERFGSKKNRSGGLGAAVAGMAAMVQCRKEAAGFEALYNAMLDVLVEVAPDHHLVTNREERLAIYNKAYQEG